MNEDIRKIHDWGMFNDSDDYLNEEYNVNDRLFGIYSPDEDLLAVHKTESGAEKNKLNYIKEHGDGFYVDFVIILP